MAALEIIDEHVRSFNSHDANAWAARYAPDVVIHDPQYPEPLRGRAAAQKDVEDFFAAFPDIQFTVTNKTGTGDLAALEGNATGTHRGPMENPGGTIPPTNKRVTMPFAAFVRVKPDDVTRAQAARVLDHGAADASLVTPE